MRSPLLVVAAVGALAAAARAELIQIAPDVSARWVETERGFTLTLTGTAMTVSRNIPIHLGEHWLVDMVLDMNAAGVGHSVVVTGSAFHLRHPPEPGFGPGGQGDATPLGIAFDGINAGQVTPIFAERLVPHEHHWDRYTQQGIALASAGGEIRSWSATIQGFHQFVPAPGTVTLGAIAGLVATRRRR